jgi:hypothetical protein
MLDRMVVKEFLEEEFEERSIEIPKDISKQTLVETFCSYTEDDYYEWLRDNFKSFFNYGKPNWNWIKGNINKSAKK